MKMVQTRRVLAFAKVFLGWVGACVLSAHASAQCPTPDNLDGSACCAPTNERLPKLGTIAQQSLDICWSDCGIAGVGNCIAKWKPQLLSSTTGFNCGVSVWTLRLTDAIGTLKWSGKMLLTYSRTWQEIDPSGQAVQVWRYLVNGDLVPTPAAGVIPCPVPPCAPAFGAVRYTGYIDFAETCGVAGQQIAWMLTHACDPIDHAPGFPRAGAFHPGRSYTFVGPAAGFVPATVVPTEGTPGSPFESIRRLNWPVPGTAGPVTCELEERAFHVLNPVAPLCFCSVGLPVSAQWALGNLTANGSCGTAIGTPGGPLLPGFLSMGIGTWTNPNLYPGVQALRWNAGQYNYFDACSGAALQEIFFGVTTIGGFPASQVLTTGVGAALPPTFIDQGSSVRAGGGLVMNIPYRTDRVINLNH